MAVVTLHFSSIRKFEKGDFGLFMAVPMMVKTTIILSL